MPLNCGGREYAWESIGCKDIKPVNLKGNQPWILTGRTHAETPLFWSSDAKSWHNGKVYGAGKAWGQKRASEDEMAGWHHQYNGHELGQTSGDGESQGGLECFSPWGLKELTWLDDWIAWIKLFIYKNSLWASMLLPWTLNVLRGSDPDQVIQLVKI